MASDTWGKVSATRFRNTVSERRIVTPARITNMEKKLCGQNKLSSANPSIPHLYGINNSNNNNPLPLITMQFSG